MVREKLRTATWRRAAERRPDMRGLEHGVDREVSQALLDSGKLLPPSQAVLRKIMAGGVWTQERAFRANLQPSPVCPFCQEAPEDHVHLWWHCPRWQTVRKAHARAAQSFSEEWPACFSKCGIVPLGLELADPDAACTQRATRQAVVIDDDVVSVAGCAEDSGSSRAGRASKRPSRSCRQVSQ